MSQLFPSPTGVNHYESMSEDFPSSRKQEKGFRPQQGLTIMNEYLESHGITLEKFPSPTGVNHYE